MRGEISATELWRLAAGSRLVVRRAGPWQRLRGLIGRPPPPPSHALLFTRCRSLHACLMGYELDAVFVDDRLRVIDTRRLRPWRAVACRAAAHALELRAGECDRLGIREGDRLERLNSNEREEAAASWPAGPT